RAVRRGGRRAAGDRGGGDDGGDRGQALGERADGFAVTRVDRLQRGRPDDGAQRVDGGDRRGGVGGAGERDEATDGLRPVAVGPQRVELAGGAERAHDGGAQRGPLRGERGGGERARLLQRRAFDQRQQPALGDRLPPLRERLDHGPIDRARTTRT